MQTLSKEPKLLEPSKPSKATMKRKPKARIIEDSIDSMSIDATEDLEKETGALDEMKVDFECTSAEIVVIDEYQGNFLPMVLFKIDRVSFQQTLTKVG